MTTFIKRGTDLAAPDLTATVGSMITLLDYVLVTTMGWTKDFTGTNQAAYRAPAGNRFYLWVNDANATFTYVRGYESMSDISTGSGAFPTVAQLPNGIMIFKGSTASVNVVGTGWTFYSNEKIFHLLTKGGNPGNATAAVVATSIFTFGDFDTLKVGDTFNTMISGCFANYNPTAAVDPSIVLNIADVNLHGGCYIARAYTQLGSAIQGSKVSNTAGNFSGRIGAGSLTYPSAIDGGLLMSPIFLQEGLSGVRGRIPGLWSPLHNRPLVNGDTFSGVDGMSASTFEAINLGYLAGALSGQVFMESSDTWSD